MKFFYGILVAVYIAWFIWYGGNGVPITDKELEQHIALMKKKSSSSEIKQAETEVLMRKLAMSDSGGDFLMVNLIRFRPVALYPEDSIWANETDALAADGRYTAGVIKELLARGSLPILKADTTNVFIVDEDWRNWDVVAIVRYRSVKDMLDMIVGMADSGLAIHKFASIEQTHVFPVQPVINLFSVRFLLALLLFSLAIVITLLVQIWTKNKAL